LTEVGELVKVGPRFKDEFSWPWLRPQTTPRP